MPWTEKDLALNLDAAGVEFEILTTKEDTPTVLAAAEALGVAPEAIVKSVLFADRDAKDRFVLVIARGLSRVDHERLARHAPGKWRLASPEEVERVTGYSAGTVPPVGHLTRVPTVMDTSVHAMQEVIGGGGGRYASLRIARADVERLTKCEVHDVAYEPS